MTSFADGVRAMPRGAGVTIGLIGGFAAGAPALAQDFGAEFLTSSPSARAGAVAIQAPKRAVVDSEAELVTVAPDPEKPGLVATTLWSPERYGPDSPETAQTRFRLAIASTQADRFDPASAVTGDRAVEIGGRATWTIGGEDGGVSVTPRLGWRAAATDQGVCPAWMDFATFCNEDPLSEERRFLLTTTDVATTSWSTYVGVATKLESGLVLDVAYKNFNQSAAELEQFFNAEAENWSDRGVVMSLSVPFND